MDEELRKDAYELVLQVRRVRVGYMGYLTKALEKIGLNIPQYTALAILEEKGEITMGVLAEGLGITMGAVTNIVDRLVDAGWASRERGIEDRRIVKVAVTDAGREALAKAVAVATDFLAHYLAGVPADQRKAFIAVYRKVADLITAAPHGRFDSPAQGE